MILGHTVREVPVLLIGEIAKERGLCYEGKTLGGDTKVLPGR